MLSVKTLSILALYSVAGATGLTLFAYASPKAEAWLAPVLENQSVVIDDDDRTPGRMCWTWKWNKVRRGQPIALSWSISVEGTAVEFPAITERQRDGEVLRNPQAASLGPGQNDLCVKIPSDLDKVEGLTIRGQINYRMPHGLWTTWQDLPVVRIPPLP